MNSHAQVLKVADIMVNAVQRRSHDAAGLERLAHSVKEADIIQPLVVVQGETGFELLAGSRRLQAAQLAGLSEVPTLVLDVSPERFGLINAIENLQREDLNRVDEVDAVLQVLSSLLDIPLSDLSAYLHRLRRAHNGMSKGEGVDAATAADLQRLESVWTTLSKDAWPSFVANKLAVLTLPQDLLEAVREGELPYSKAVALRKVKNPEARAELLSEIADSNLGVREVREKARESVERQADDAARLAAETQQLAQTTRWRALDPDTRRRAAALLQELRNLFENT